MNVVIIMKNITSFFPFYYVILFIFFKVFFSLFEFLLAFWLTITSWIRFLFLFRFSTFSDSISNRYFVHIYFIFVQLNCCANLQNGDTPPPLKISTKNLVIIWAWTPTSYILLHQYIISNCLNHKASSSSSGYLSVLSQRQVYSSNVHSNDRSCYISEFVFEKSLISITHLLAWEFDFVSSLVGLSFISCVCA